MQDVECDKKDDSVIILGLWPEKSGEQRLTYTEMVKSEREADLR